MVTAKGADIPFRAGVCQPPPCYVKWGAGGRAQFRGETVEGDKVEVIAKLSPTGKLVIITVYIP